MEEPPEKTFPLASLTDELLVEVFSRLPVRSLCRFKCVCRSWRNLISGRGHRKKLPHTLVGFFYKSFSDERVPYSAQHFTNVTGKGIPFLYPSFSFLPVCSSDDVVPLDCCNGLLLCRCFLPVPCNSDGDRPFHYAVCNPATEKWVMLPDGSWAADEAGIARTTRLGFDPKVSSHFYVIECVVDEAACYVIGVEIYSSKTGEWSFKEHKWGNDVMLDDRSRSVFLNGFMHMLTYNDGIIAVDMEGKTWRKIPVRGDDEDYGGCIHQTQGLLCWLDVDIQDNSKLLIWILEDYNTNKWTLKHTVSTMKLFGRKNVELDYGPWGNQVIAVHPECNLVFFVCGWDKMLMAYEMDRREMRVIRSLGHDSHGPYLPYVPFFSDSLAEEH